jgi:hypothetical protein
MNNSGNRIRCGIILVWEKTNMSLHTELGFTGAPNFGMIKLFYAQPPIQPWVYPETLGVFLVALRQELLGGEGRDEGGRQSASCQCGVAPSCRKIKLNNNTICDSEGAKAFWHGTALGQCKICRQDAGSSAPEKAGRWSGESPLLCGEESCGIEP